MENLRNARNVVLLALRDFIGQIRAENTRES